MGINAIPDKPEEDRDSDEGFEDDDDFGEDAFGGESSSFSCPFCGSGDDGCPHFLGSRDLNFCGDFAVDDVGELAKLREVFEEVGKQVVEFVEAGKKKARIALLKPRRLRELAQAIAEGEYNDGFTEYIVKVGKDTKVGVASSSHEEDSGPGFCSAVRMYWARDINSAIAGMRQRITQDAQRLYRLVKPGAPPDKSRK